MRVSENTSFTQVRNNLEKTRSRMQDDQLIASSMKKINAPSDDPVNTVKMMGLKKELTVNKQFGDNISFAKSFMNFTDTALEDLTDILMRAKEISLQQSSGAGANEDSRYAVAGEVKNLTERALSIANRRVGNRYIFGGYKMNTPPFDDKYKYPGDGGKVNIETMRDVYVEINVPGSEIFFGKNYDDLSVDKQAEKLNHEPNVGDDSLEIDPSVKTNKGSNVFHVLDRLRVALLANDTVACQGSINDIDEALGQTIAQRSKVGAKLASLETSTGHIAKAEVLNNELLSEITDADIVKVVSDLQREETVLKSALGASQKLLQPSLLDWFR